MRKNFALFAVVVSAFCFSGATLAQDVAPIISVASEVSASPPAGGLGTPPPLFLTDSCGAVQSDCVNCGIRKIQWREYQICTRPDGSQYMSVLGYGPCGNIC